MRGDATDFLDSFGKISRRSTSYCFSTVGEQAAEPRRVYIVIVVRVRVRPDFTNHVHEHVSRTNEAVAYRSIGVLAFLNPSFHHSSLHYFSPHEAIAAC